MTSERPKLWSDFDGTAVELAGKISPFRATKYPLRGKAGYADFLDGVLSTGVEMGGTVTRRPDVYLRRRATALSITRLGYGRYFNQPDQIVHTGTEEAKGHFLAEQARATTVGMLEDRPHHLGGVLLGVLSEPLEHPEAAYRPIVIGVVNHAQSREYITSLMASIRAVCDLTAEVEEITTVGSRAPITSFRVVADAFSLHVTPLEPYTFLAGEAFGTELMSHAAKR